MNIKNWFIKYINEIIIAIMVGIFMKWWDFLVQLIPQTGQSIWEAFIDFIFRETANQSSVSLIGYIFQMVIGSFVGFFLGFLTRCYFYIFKREKKGINTMNSEQMNAVGQKTRRRTIIMLFITIFLLLAYLYTVSMACVYYPARKWHNYQLDMLLVSPYISEQELKLFNSQWVSMQGKADYNAIYEKINQIKKENNLTRGKQKRNK